MWESSLKNKERGADGFCFSDERQMPHSDLSNTDLRVGCQKFNFSPLWE